ncbi:MAG: NAD(P)-dependent oxidoreductase [Cryobacterium sp.]|nr:NAD(P)-dependent oxidoreductase [Cryobacterium sp.]
MLERRDRFDIVVLAHDTPSARKAMKKLGQEPGLKIVWGDLRDYEAVLECVTGADIILHTAALISPAADRDPVAAREINVGSIRNILRAIKAQPEPDAVKLVTIGSVAMTGSRLPPLHWGRIGDPIHPSIFDYYAISKIEAERLVLESDLKHWVSLRQTFICIPDLLSLLHPIFFHQPLNTQFEFVTAADSGRLMANACEESVPESFWRRVYNIGGGQACRVDYLSYMDRIFGVLHLGSVRQLTRRNWFALRNFHCQWYLDSDELEEVLHFRRDGMDEYAAQVAASAPWYLRIGLGRIIPRSLIRGLVMKRMARAPEGPLHWIETDQTEKVEAFFGSKTAWEQIPDWSEPIPQPGLPVALDYGFDSSKPDSQLELADLRSAAKFRGGDCLSNSFSKGRVHSKVLWKCQAGHEFETTAYTVLRAGHWCPDCQPPPWRPKSEQTENKFLTQVLE